MLILKRSLHGALGIVAIAAVSAVLVMWLDQGRVFDTHSWGEVRFGGLYLLPAAALLNLAVDAWNVFVVRSRVEFDASGLRDCTRAGDSDFYAWEEIIDLRVNGPSWRAHLALAYRAKTLQGDTLVDSAAVVKIGALHLPRRAHRRLDRLLADRLPANAGARSD